MVAQAQGGGQAPSQSQQGQAPDGSAAQQTQSLSEQVYGQAPTTEAPKGQGQQGSEQLLPGQKAGESVTDYANRIATELQRARQDAGKYRTELRNKVGETEPDAEGKTEFQRLQDQLGKLTQDLDAERLARRVDRVSTQAVTALAEAGALAPARAQRMLDIPDTDIGADGSISKEALAHAIATLKTEVPAIFTDVRGSGDGGVGNGSGIGQPQDFNAEIRARARR